MEEEDGCCCKPLATSEYDIATFKGNSSLGAKVRPAKLANKCAAAC